MTLVDWVVLAFLIISLVGYTVLGVKTRNSGLAVIFSSYAAVSFAILVTWALHVARHG